MTAPPTSPCGSRATADGKAPPRATAAGFSHCSKASMRPAPVAAASGEGLSCRISQPTGSNRTASRMRGPPNFAERKERAVARRLFPRSTKSAPPRPAPRRPSGASLTRSGPTRCAPSVFTTDGGYDDHALRPHPGTAGRAAGLPFTKRERAAVEAELAKALAEQAEIERRYDRAMEACREAEAIRS